jgi:hypothetical protein
MLPSSQGWMGRERTAAWWCVVVSAAAWRVVWYRFVVTFRQRWGGLLALVLLVGLVGGLAMGAVAGARRTQASFPAFLANTNASDLVVATSPTDSGYDAALLRKIARLPHVKRLESATALNVVGVQRNGAAVVAARRPQAAAFVDLVGSVDGLYFDEDRVTVIHGRMADPKRPDEVVMSADAARALGMHVGGSKRLGFYTNAETNVPGYRTTVKPHHPITAKVVGVVAFNNALVRDDTDRYPTEAIFTPALTATLARCCAGTDTLSGLQLDHGSRDVAAVEAEIERVLTPDSFLYFHATSIVQAQAERAIKPESIALGVFGAIAALAVLVIAAQAIGRQLRLGADDLIVLRALGASPATTASDGLVGIVGAVVVGALLAAGVAVGLSAFTPFGPVHMVDPSPGIAFDWTVLGLGVLALIVTLSTTAVILAYRGTPARMTRRRERGRTHHSNVARRAGASGLPVPAVTGIRFALEPGNGRNTVPVRSAIVGAALAVIVVVATVTFGSSLNTLVSHPALYGWNWNYELLGAFGGGSNVPQQHATQLLGHDPDVAAWSGVYFATLRIDGHTVPGIGASSHATVTPPSLSGHAFDAPNQIVLGATTLAELHKHLGDTVAASYGRNTPRRLKIVGTATMPTVGTGGALHLSMGIGALTTYTLIPAAVRDNTLPGPNAIFVRLRHGTNPTTAARTLTRIANALSTPNDVDGPVSLVTVQRPAEIINYHSQQTTSRYLGATLALGAITALTLTLIASVRRRQRDLALLKTLGLTRRQLAAVVAWQSSVAVTIGIAVGVPIGIILGRWLWTLFAQTIHAVPQPTIPTLSIALVAVSAFVFANLVAVIPARQAARTTTAALLRAE